MLSAHFAILFAIIYLCDGHDPIPPPQPPLNQLAGVVKSFKSTELCQHICIAKTWFDKTGVYISFTTDRNQGETADDLCNCMYNYINQNNWLVETNYKCCFDSKTLTMTLSGPPNKDNDLPDTNAPLAALAAILKQFPSADLGGHKCYSSSTLDKSGLTHLLLQCELTCDSPSPQDVCKNIMAYLNQNGWLGKPETNCSSKKFDLTLEIVGK